jgi:hypothetical protein
MKAAPFPKTNAYWTCVLIDLLTTRKLKRRGTKKRYDSLTI